MRTPELGGVGFWVVGAGVASVDGTPLDDAEFEERRIEAGTPRYGVDMGEDRLPIEAGINDAVSFDKGCYLGQEVIARATNLGHINRRLVGLVLDGEAPAAAGAKLSSPSKPDAGWITSSARSRRLGKTIALGYVHRTLWDPGTQLTVADGRSATVAALPSDADGDWLRAAGYFEDFFDFEGAAPLDEARSAAAVAAVLDASLQLALRDLAPHLRRAAIVSHSHRSSLLGGLRATHSQPRRRRRQARSRPRASRAGAPAPSGDACRRRRAP